MTYRISITESDLQAYADGQLTTARARQVEEYIKQHPEAAVLVEYYRELSEGIHELYDPVLNEPTPAQLLVPRRRVPLWRVAAGISLFVAGFVFARVLTPGLSPVAMVKNQLDENLIRPASFAHAVYSPEIRHPVEVEAKNLSHLVSWLSKRLKFDLKVPDLTGLGYEIVGGRLLPSTDRMAAQLMYQREDGVRVTLYIRRGAWENNETAFHYERRDNIGVLYWIDGELGYALSGQLDKGHLQRLSEVVYHQLVQG